jgi:hypothetical protein
VQPRVFGLPDHAHPALADLLDEAVMKQLLAGFDRHLLGFAPRVKARVYSGNPDSAFATQILRVDPINERRP